MDFHLLHLVTYDISFDIPCSMLIIIEAKNVHLKPHNYVHFRLRNGTNIQEVL